MTLVSRLTLLQQRLGGLHSRFGEPQYASTVSVDGQALEPNPKVTQIDRRMIGKYLVDQVMVVGDETVVSEIPRIIPEADLEAATWTIDGYPYRLVWLDTSQTVTYSAYLVPKGSK